MGKIFYVMGKSASGQVTIYKRLHSRMPELKTVTMYTTRPIRDGEHNGVEYFFVNVLSHIVSEDQTVLAQNYALGVSAAGFVLYALFEHFCKDRLKEVCFIFIALLSVLCMAFIYM